MPDYLLAAMGIYLAVDWLLLFGTNRLTGAAPGRVSMALACLGGTAMSLIAWIPGFAFARSGLWQLLRLLLTALTAYGFRAGALIRMLVYLLLHLAVQGLCLWTGHCWLWALPAAALLVLLLMLMAGRKGAVGGRMVRVELSWQGRQLAVNALVDTGNCLSDPITGQQVLVLSAPQAQYLTGLTPQQLRNPVESLQAVPGMRLIPFRTVNSTGLLLALKLNAVRIGSYRGSAVVAFAPQILDPADTYQALTGGM